MCRIALWLGQLKTMIYSSLFFLRQCESLDWSDLFSLSAPFPLPLTRPISSSLRFQHGGFVSKNICAPEENAYKKGVRKFMSRISGIIAFQTKKSNLERDLRKETDIKWVTKGNRKIPHTLFWSFICQSDAIKRTWIFNNGKGLELQQ